MGQLIHPEGLKKSHEFTLKRDRAGLWSGTQIYSCRKDELATVVPAQYTPHPDFPFVHVDVVTVLGMEKGLCRVAVEYAGALHLGEPDQDVVNPPEYELDVAVSEEPWQLAAYFTDDLTAAEIQDATEQARNPARDSDGEVEAVDQTGWPAKQVELYDDLRGGRESYRQGKQTWAKRWVSDAPVDGREDVGYIDVPDGDSQGWESGRDWLLTGLRQRRRGVVYENEKTWELSGAGGWESKIYTKPAP